MKKNFANFGIALSREEAKRVLGGNVEIESDSDADSTCPLQCNASCGVNCECKHQGTKNEYCGKR